MTRTLLLHPLGTDRHCWNLTGFDTLAMDLPGHGETPCLPHGARIPDFADMVVASLAGERVHVVGVSLGGLVAQDLAARHPELVNRLVLVDTVATYPEPMREMWRNRANIARSRGLAELADPMATMWFTEPFLSHQVPKRIRETFLAMNPEGYARACEALEAADTTATAARIKAPTLIACGRSDQPPFTEAARWLQNHIADAELTWLPGKHATFLEHPTEFTAALTKFGVTHQNSNRTNRIAT